MRCFVAMAFSREDTDAMYETAIRGALLSRDITPVRMDKVEHNDNVDDRVLTEIRTSDFAIIDLTYARPSVYYEAGYAEREIPVIYTIRRDHLSPYPSDEHGVFRLHFDLAMRNVIDWIPGDDEVFRSRLGNRIDLVVRPLAEAAAAKGEVAARRAAFQALPVTERERVVIQSAGEFLQRNGFTTAREVEEILGLTAHRFSRGDAFFKVDGTTYRVVNVKTHLNVEESPRLFVDALPEYNLNVHAALNRITTIEEHWLLCAFHGIPLQGVCHKMGDFRSVESRRVLVKEMKVEVPRLSDDYTGDVIVRTEEVSLSALQTVFRGGDPYNGFLTKTPPPGTSHVRAKYPHHLRFVYSGFSSRVIDRVICFHVFDEIASVDDLEERLEAALSAVP